MVSEGFSSLTGHEPEGLGRQLAAVYSADRLLTEGFTVQCALRRCSRDRQCQVARGGQGKGARVEPVS